MTLYNKDEEVVGKRKKQINLRFLPCSVKKMASPRKKCYLFFCVSKDQLRKVEVKQVQHFFLESNKKKCCLFFCVKKY